MENTVYQNKLYTECYGEIESLVAICGAKAIDTVMSADDPNWFAAFKAQEAAMPDSRRTVQPYHTSIYDSDFQGIVKIFCYREVAADVGGSSPIIISDVFDRYNLPAKTCGPKSFCELCKTLIANRNLVHHVSAEAISGNDEKKIKAHITQCKKSIFDCLRFLEFFPDVCDSDGMSYLDKANNKLSQTEKNLGISSYNIPELLCRENINLTVKDFVDLCADLHFDTYYRNGIAYLESDNIGTTLAIVKTVLERTPAKKKSGKAMPIVFAVLLATIAILLAILILKPDTSDNPGNNNPSQTQKPTTSDSSSSIPTQSEDTSSEEGPREEQIRRFYDPVTKESDFVKNALVLVPIEVFYNEDEKLVVNTKLLSGYDADIDRIYVKNLKIVNGDGTLIAEKTFDYTQDLFVHHWSNSVDYDFTLEPEDIRSKYADLVDLKIEAEFDHPLK